MQAQGNSRRSYGTGSIIVRRDANGRETWFGLWRVNGRRVKRKLGPKRIPGTSDGLTKPQAEAALRKLMESEAAPARRVTVEQAGERLVAHLEQLQRSPNTLDDYRSYLRVNLVPFFGDKPLDRITPRDVEAFMAKKAREGRAPKSILNWYRLLHAVFAYAQKRMGVQANPCQLVDLPRVDPDEDIRFLTKPDVEKLLEAVPDDDFGRVEHVMYLAAVMTGMRQGEMRGLRWQDIDWLASRVRVRRNYTRKRYGKPKSRRSSRSVPLALRLAAELETHFQRSAYQADDDLVFCHPHTGNPVDNSKILKRFKQACEDAGIARYDEEGKVSNVFHDLRHTFGTQMAAAGVPMRTLQEWMGHRDFKTTLVYADYAPSAHEADFVERAFADSGFQQGSNLSKTQPTSGDVTPHETAESHRQAPA
jgi:integrase